MPNSFDTDPGSFRDRTSRVCYHDGRVLRFLDETAYQNWTLLARSSFYAAALRNREIVATDEQPAQALAAPWRAMLRHERIPFVSYPYEWCFGMLKDAALLQLRLLSAALEENMILKDATPYNVQFHGSRPVFIDIPSFEALAPGQVWVGYRQFCELFLYPLMLQAYRRVPFQTLLRGDLEGISPGYLNNLFSFGDLLRPGVFKHVLLHSKLQDGFANSNRDVKSRIGKAGFHKELIAANVRGLQKLVARLELPDKKSEWSDYSADCPSYSDADYSAKLRFLEEVLTAQRRGLVWDVGCNTGTFSRLAAKHADYVVGMDSDHLAIERMYRGLKSEKCENVLPLIMNVANASPNIGWRGAERKRIEDRGRPDLILALALVHHVVISANIPLNEFFEWLAAAGKELVIEFVTRSDPMVQKLLRNKVDQYGEYSLESFERLIEQRFTVQRRQELPSGTRILYLATPLR